MKAGFTTINCQPAAKVQKRDIHGKKALLCIWWDWRGVIYFELLKSGQTVTADI